MLIIIVENRMRGIIGANKEPKAPRKSTREENRANKDCSKETTADLMDKNDVVAAYPAEMKRMNRGKVGRPFRCMGGMFAWILLIMGYLDLSYGKAVSIAMDKLKRRGLSVPSISTIHRRVSEPASGIVPSAPPSGSTIGSESNFNNSSKLHPVSFEECSSRIP